MFLIAAAAKHRLRSILKRTVARSIAPRQPTRTDLPLAHWDLTVGGDHTLWLRSHRLASLAERFGTPLHVVDADRLERTAREALAPVVNGRGAEIFYSYKTNPVPEVLRRLHALGVGAEVISPYELWLAFELGVPPERIIYNGPAKSDDSLRDAIRAGVFVINANSASEVARIRAISASLATPANLGIRVSLPGMWGDQFGIASTSGEIVDVVRSALDDPFVRLNGLHFHRGITVRSAIELRGYVQAVLAFCDELRDGTGWTPSVLDVGGSLACPTTTPVPNRQFRLNRAFGCDLLPPEPAETMTLGAASELVTSVVREHFAARDLPPPIVVQEPGRALTSVCQMLLTSVVDIKHDSTPWCAVLDAGMNVAASLPNEYHQLFSVSAPRGPHQQPYRLVGPICTPADILYYNWRLPRLDRGHVLAVMDSGAYFVPFSTTFSFPRPAVVVVDGDDVFECRRRETFADIVRLDQSVDDADRRGAPT
jgi:diaminopimelate decarboxylase